MKFQGIPWNPHTWLRSSMEFHETTEVPWNVEWHEIPWNSSAPKWTITKFHRIPCHSMELWCRQMKYHSVAWNSISNGHHFKRVPFQMTQVFHGIPWNIPWNSMELWYHQMKYNLVPWNSMEYSMELWCRQMKYHLVPWNSMEYSMEFHGTLVPPNEISHWDCHFIQYHVTQGFHGIFHEIQCKFGVDK